MKFITSSLLVFVVLFISSLVNALPVLERPVVVKRDTYGNARGTLLGAREDSREAMATHAEDARLHAKTGQQYRRAAEKSLEAAEHLPLGSPERIDLEHKANSHGAHAETLLGKSQRDMEAHNMAYRQLAAQQQIHPDY